MPTILEIKNPFNQSDGLVKAHAKEGTNIREWLDGYLGAGLDFEYPTVLQLNGAEVMRADWAETTLTGADTAIFRRLPQDGGISVVVLALVGLVVGLLIPVPQFDDRDEDPSVFNISGQKNAVKLGQVVQSSYGKTRMFPPYAARSYTRYIDNDQFLYQLFCIGAGEYDMTDFKIEDTDFDSFDGTTRETYDPGESVTLFPDNIVTSVEVASLELFAPNEPEFSGETGPFVTNAVGTQTDKIEWDIVFPLGLGRTNSSGDFREKTVTADFSYREIDDDDLPVGSWVVVPFTKTLTTASPQRFTISTSVTAGRYEVKAVRTSDSEQLPRVIEVIEWYQLRSELPSTKDYGDVTLLATVIKASNNLNSNSQNKINLVGTRKLPIWNGSVFSAPTATRSPVWAFCDILRASYGGNLADSKLDLAGLLVLDAVYSGRNDTFNWSFDRNTTIYKAIKTVCSAGRAVPFVSGNKFTMVRDAEKTVPIAAFAPENILPNSFSQSIRLQPDGAYDGIEISYTDESTWREETVKCLIGTDAGVNMETITFPGITNRDKAFREGLYLRAKQIWRNDKTKITTGLEGRIPIFGDLVAVSHDTPEWGQSGFVESIAGDSVTVTLAEPLSSTQGDRIAFRDKTGAIDGPYICTVTDDTTVVTSTSITGDFLFTNTDEPPIYYFGTASTLYELFLIAEKVSNDDSEQITLENYDPRVYQYDNHIAEPIPDAPIPESPPALPAITGLVLGVIVEDPATVQANWNLADGAQYYVWQISYDNDVWSEIDASVGNSVQFLAAQGRVYFRVAVVNAGQGPFTTANVLVGVFSWITSDGSNMTTSTGNNLIFR